MVWGVGPEQARQSCERPANRIGIDGSACRGQEYPGSLTVEAKALGASQRHERLWGLIDDCADTNDVFVAAGPQTWIGKVSQRHHPPVNHHLADQPPSPS